MKRRHFFSTLGALAGGVLLDRTGFSMSDTPDFKETIHLANDDQTFWNIVKGQFIFPKDYSYLNTGGIGAVPTPVMNTVMTSMNEQQIHPGPGHDHDKWNVVKEEITNLLSPACKKEEIALISTATEGINIVLNGLPLKKGDEIITSAHEHPALHIPLANLMQRKGIVPRVFEPDMKNGAGNVDRIKKLMTKRTKLIFISHITCTTGQRFPLKDIGQLAKDNGLWFAIDGAQAGGSMPMDVTECNIHFYAFSGHKWTLGPKRTGILYVRLDMLDTLKPTTVGAYSADDFDLSNGNLKLNPTAERYEFATQNDAIFHGLGKAANFVKTIGLQRIKDHNKALAERFYFGLKEIPDVQILSPEEEEYRTAMITFKIKGKIFRDVGSFLTDEKQIRVRVVPEAGLEGIRVSFHVYNNEEDVARILKEVRSFSSS